MREERKWGRKIVWPIPHSPQFFPPKLKRFWDKLFFPLAALALAHARFSHATMLTKISRFPGASTFFPPFFLSSHFLSSPIFLSNKQALRYSIIVVSALVISACVLLIIL